MPRGSPVLFSPSLSLPVKPLCGAFVLPGGSAHRFLGVSPSASPWALKEEKRSVRRHRRRVGAARYAPRFRVEARRRESPRSSRALFLGDVVEKKSLGRAGLCARITGRCAHSPAPHGREGVRRTYAPVVPSPSTSNMKPECRTGTVPEGTFFHRRRFRVSFHFLRCGPPILSGAEWGRGETSPEVRTHNRSN